MLFQIRLVLKHLFTNPLFASWISIKIRSIFHLLENLLSWLFLPEKHFKLFSQFALSFHLCFKAFSSMLIFCFISNARGCLFMSMHVYKTRYGRNLKRRGTDSCPSPTKSIYSLSFSLLTNSAVFLLISWQESTNSPIAYTGNQKTRHISNQRKRQTKKSPPT